MPCIPRRQTRSITRSRPNSLTSCSGLRRKYSCCLYETDTATLAEAERAALARPRAGAARDGQTILELGCGWGSLSLWMAEQFPATHPVCLQFAIRSALSSRPRRETRGLANLRVVTADAKQLSSPGLFDRVVSVEMFEHVSNWPALLARIRSWLKPDGLLFLHVFAHCACPIGSTTRTRSTGSASTSSPAASCRATN